MAAHVPRLCGEEWQEWANRLLSHHYGPTEYQQVPDNDRGDGGIEGYTRCSGHAYQAYGCEEPISTKARYDKQRDKMTEDVGKFIARTDIFTKILGTCKITRWALFVPYCDSRSLLSHATAKTSEVLAASLPYVDASFQVCVCQESDFSVARDHLMNTGTRTLSVESSPSTPEEVAAWAASNQEPSSILTGKLRRLPTLSSERLRASFHGEVLQWFLRGRDILEALRQYPEIYAKVTQAKSHRERFLSTAIVGGASGPELFKQAINDLQQTFAKQVGELHAYPAEHLVHEAVADWLLRCPLDFPELSHGD